MKEHVYECGKDEMKIWEALHRNDIERYVFLYIDKNTTFMIKHYKKYLHKKDEFILQYKKYNMYLKTDENIPCLCIEHYHRLATAERTPVHTPCCCIIA